MSNRVPEITDGIPKELKTYCQDYEDLKQELDRVIPAKIMSSNLLIATWNIKMFGDLKQVWEDTNVTPRRNLTALTYIAEIVRRFDVIAIQEVTGNLKCLRHMLKLLGGDWGLLMTDEVRGSRGNRERFVFVFDTRRVNLSGLACELVVPSEEMKRRGVAEPKYPIDKQFARTPYAVGFTSQGRTFVLVTLHVIFGKEDVVKNKGRAEELLVIAQWLSDWALDINLWEHNLIALGDFNIDRRDDYLYKAFESGGLEVHQHFHDLPRTLKDKGADPDDRNYYDQISWFTGADGKPALSLRFLKGGYFDFTACVFRGMSNSKLEWRMSDHFPLWAEFEVAPTEVVEIPTVSESLTAEMKEEKKKDDEIRGRLVLALTELENAAVAFIDVLVGTDLEVTEEAEKWFINLLFRDVVINAFRNKLEASEVNKTIPQDRARELAELVKNLVEAENKKSVTLKDVKDTIVQFDEWPFEAARVGG